jgi:small multidrug resistance family-3 protein
MTLRSIGLFVAAALFEIGGAWLVWQTVREHRAWWLAALHGYLRDVPPAA